MVSNLFYLVAFGLSTASKDEEAADRLAFSSRKKDPIDQNVFLAETRCFCLLCPLEQTWNTFPEWTRKAE